MLTKDDIIRLRKSTSDDSIFSSAMEQDPDFRSAVDNVKSSQEFTPLEEYHFPRTMLNLKYGIEEDRPTPSVYAYNAAETAMQQVKKKEIPQQGAFDQMVDSPLRFGMETVKNIPRSGMNLVGGLASMVAHPLQTGKSLFQLGVGGTANTIESIASLAGVKNPEDIFNLESEEVASAVGDFYVKRYGSLESAANTLREDPVGFLSDLGAVVTGVGGAVKGGATAVGAVTGAATRGSTALTGLGRGIRATQAAGSSLMRTGINMEPIVIAGKGAIMAGRGITNATIAGVRGVAPSAMATKALKINPSDIRAFQNLPGNELPGDFLLRKGILSGGDFAVGEEGLKMTGMSPVGRTRVGIIDDLDRLWRKAKDVVDSELAGVKQTYDVLDDVPSEVPKLVDEILTIANKYDLQEPRSFIQALLKKERVSLTDLNELKRVAYDMFTTYKRSNLADDSFRAQQIISYERGLRSFIESEAAKKGLPDIAILNQDTQKAREILDAMYHADAASWSKGRLTLGLMDGMFGIGAYSLTGDFFSTAGIVVGRKFLESTLFKTTFAKYLNRLDPTQIDIVKKAFQSLRHTKESKQIVRKVVSQTAEEIKNKRIGEQESLNSQLSTQQGRTGQQTQGVIPESLPNTLPEASKPVNKQNMFDDFGNLTPEEIARLTPEERATGMLGGGDGMARTADKTYYHVTSAEAAQSIQKSGFKPQIGERSMGVSNAKGTWLYEDSASAPEFGKNFKNPVTIETKVNGKIFDGMGDDRSIRALAEDAKLISKLRKEGYVGIKGDEMGTPATFIFEPKSISPIVKDPPLGSLDSPKAGNPKGAGAIPKELEPLAVEAREYNYVGFAENAVKKLENFKNKVVGYSDSQNLKGDFKIGTVQDFVSDPRLLTNETRNIPVVVTKNPKFIENGDARMAFTATKSGKNLAGAGSDKVIFINPDAGWGEMSAFEINGGFGHELTHAFRKMKGRSLSANGVAYEDLPFEKSAAKAQVHFGDQREFYKALKNFHDSAQ